MGRRAKIPEWIYYKIKEVQKMFDNWVILWKEITVAHIAQQFPKEKRFKYAKCNQKLT